MIRNTDYFQTVHQIINTGHWFTDRLNTGLKDYQITEPKYNVLRILRWGKGTPITVHEIQERMIQRSSNVTRILDKLIRKGLVNRHECPSNRRRMDVTITSMGEDLLVWLDRKVHDFHKPISENLTKAEAERLKKTGN